MELEVTSLPEATYYASTHFPPVTTLLVTLFVGLVAKFVIGYIKFIWAFCLFNWDLNFIDSIPCGLLLEYKNKKISSL